MNICGSYKHTELLLLTIATLLALLLSGCQPLQTANAASVQGYDLSRGWQLSTPQKQGVSADALSAFSQAIKAEYPSIDSAIMVKNGYIIFEEYYQNSDERTYHTVYSITKSVTSFLVGIAIDQGLIADVQQPIAELLGDPDPEIWRNVTIEKLLTMSAGFDNTITYRDMNTCLTVTDEWHDCLADAVRAAPDTGEFLYTESGAHLLSIILTQRSGKSALDFADAHLFGPLKIEPEYWEVDAQGHNWGGSGLHLTSRDMAKIGYLLLKGGRWGQQQIVSANWLAQATQKQSDGGPPLGVNYGYFWWLPTVADYAAYVAFGSGGQLILVIPELDTVVVVTTDSYGAAPNLLPLMETYVVPALKNKN